MIRQGQLKFRVVRYDAMDVAVRNRRRQMLIGIDVGLNSGSVSGGCGESENRAENQLPEDLMSAHLRSPMLLPCLDGEVSQ